MGRSTRLCGAATALTAALTAAPAAIAQETGVAQEWQLGFQAAAAPLMERIEWFHDWFLLPITTVIVLLVLGLLVFVMLRFNARSNPTPSRTTHNTLVEVLWTVVPVIILVAIAVPSFRLLYLSRDPPPADLTIKAIGSQWYWSYEYPDNGDLAFDSVMLTDEERGPGDPRLLAVDNELVVPVGKTVRLIVTANDVIHAWAIPAFGVKIDAIPGRINEAWFRADQPGIYYGQCSELCGQRHAFMPIEVHVVSEADFAAWLAAAQARFAAAPQPAPGPAVRPLTALAAGPGRQPAEN